MNKLNLSTLGVQEMSAAEMRSVDGGVVWFLVAAIALLATSCTLVIGDGNQIDTTVQVDSTANGSGNGNGTGNGNGIGNH